MLKLCASGGESRRVPKPSQGPPSASSDRRPTLIAIAALVTVIVLYAANGHWGQEANPDVVAVAVPAWQLARTGSLDLTGIDAIRDNQEELSRWYVYDKQGRIVSNRAPGLIAIAYPSYLVFGSDRFSNGPATLVALVLTVGAVALSWRLFARETSTNFATGAAVVLALGTTTWSVSSSELWPHGPGQFFAALAMTALAIGSYERTGLAFAGGLLMRTLTGVFAATVGIAEGWRLRSIGPVVRVGLTAFIGLALVIAYNRWLFGTWSLSGGYGDTFTTEAVGRLTAPRFLGNVTSMFVGPRHGVLTTSPVLAVATIGAIIHRRELRSWMKTGVFAALAYLLVHAALNRASGGMAMFYRYPLEAIILASPALLVGAKRLWDSSRRWRLILIAAAISSVLVQLMYVFLFECVNTGPDSGACTLQLAF